MFCLYLRFSEAKIDKLKNWNRLFKNIREAGSNISIYIWIETTKNPADIINNNPYNLIFVTHYNQLDYCDTIINKDDNVNIFCKNIGITGKYIDQCKKIIRSFHIPKEKYIYNINGENIFYLDLTYDMLVRGVDYMKLHNLNILARPYWITIDHGFSFDFVLQKKHMINKLFIDNSQKLQDGYKYYSFFKKNIDRGKIMNFENYFGMLLFNYYRYTFREIFFSFKENPYWKSINICEPFINEATTQIFADRHSINKI